MAAFTLPYGKRMLKASLDGSVVKKARKRMKRLSPDEDAKWWCATGLDKDGFVTKYISDFKGFGVFAAKEFSKGEFLLEYVGEKISEEEANRRQKKHADNKIYHYSYQGTTWCLDASGTQGHICQLVNDGYGSSANACMKLKDFGKGERLCLYALRDIKLNEEILYDYGDGQNLWWRNKNIQEYLSDSYDSDPFELKEGVESDTDTDSDDQESFELKDQNESPGPVTDHDVVEDSNRIEIDCDYCESSDIQNLNGSQIARLGTDVTDVVEDWNIDVDNQEYSGLKDGNSQPLIDIIEDSNMSETVETCGEFPALQLVESTCGGKQNKKSKNKKKPDRYCVYCKNVLSGGKLKRHIKRKHKGEPEVMAILSKPAAIQNAFFEEKRRQGIYEYNLTLISEDKEPTMRERTPYYEDQLRVCTDCKGYFSNKYFFKHKCVAQNPQALKPKLLQAASLSRQDNDQGFRDILNKFRDGEVGDLCRTNVTIKLIGYRHYNLRRHEDGKQDEVRKVVMAEMRELSKLFLKFQALSGSEKTVEDMFQRENLQDLVDALQELVKVDNREKHGQKLFLDAIIMRSVKTLLGHYAETMQDGKGKALKYFKIAYKHKSNELFPSARQTCIQNSLEKSRKPSNLPSEQALRELKEFLTAEITSVINNYESRSYASLRSLVVARLTLFNSRRGEEASRLLVKEWEDAEKGVWLPEEQIEQITDPAERFLLGKFKLAYLKGKGKKFVPVLIPVDLIPAIKLLKTKRIEFGIREDNPFLFATKHSSSHCSGWHAVSEVCGRAGISISVTATKMRHRLSSLYASLDMKTEDRAIFLEHMGHEDNVNKENYQCPPGVQTTCVMGKMLSTVDEGINQKSPPRCRSTDENQGRSEKRGSILSMHVTSTNENQEMTEKSDSRLSDTDGDAVAETEEVENDRKTTNRNNSVKWTPKDTRVIRDYFKEFILQKQAVSSKNEGSLPSKGDILAFLEKENLVCLDALSTQEKYKKIRTKIFNERKKTRTKTFNTIQKLEKK